jgi:hypothetical protein
MRVVVIAGLVLSLAQASSPSKPVAPTLPVVTGDGGAAKSARLRSPAGVVVDIAGNLYIAAAGNRKPARRF